MVDPGARGDSANGVEATEFRDDVVGIHGLFEGEGTPIVQFVVESARRHGSEVQREPAAKRIFVHYLVLAGMQIELPAAILSSWIGVEPSGNRQTEINKAAECPHGTLRSDDYLSGGVGPQYHGTRGSTCNIVDGLVNSV